jgi:antitoxin ParD1/3/4
MSIFDITRRLRKITPMNVSLTDPMEKYVRQKVAVGEYETASEVVREGLRLLQHRDEVWRSEVDGKIKAGIASVLAGKTLSADQVKAGMAVFKKKWSKSRTRK